ncbi:hypothetical protein PR048_000005 [Dryococelus australis]|uniref:PiggyBac transposable element-derived protein domain-containing protein n=1 Tax=Dryococelus australis TaxID=614101 RepID=A0ABQ9IFL7_9NEOP|nr:hypothetical protein PR048_000005 [Dryococelus australis]
MAKAVTLSNGQPIPHSARVRTPAHNLVRKLPGTIGDAKKLDKNYNVESSWSCVFSQNMLDEILQRNNEKIQPVESLCSEDMRYLVREMDMVELKATLRHCYLSGAFRSGHEDMTYLFLSSVLKFDNALGREIRRENYPLAAIYCVFNELVKNSQASITVGSYVCLDEMLVGFRGNCKFRIYMASKPKSME